MVNSIKCVIAMLLVVAFSMTANAAIDVRIDRQTLSINETVRVVFVADREVDTPDFSPLERDFELLGTAMSSNVSLVNRQVQATISWTVDLAPRRVGELTVPPIAFGGEMSEEIKVRAVPAAVGTADSEMFLEVEANPATPYVQAQMRLTVRVFRAVRISDATLTEPNISSGDAVIERLGEDIQYETTRGGVRFAVVERRYAIFPQQSGQLVIDPIVFAARVGGSSSFLARSGGRIVRERSEAMEIEVQPIPDPFPGQVWLPAENLILSEDWPGDSTQWRVGEPLTRTLILRARGLTASQLPEIGMPLPDGFKQYPDQPQLNTRPADITQLASRRETIALIPSRAGEYTLPAIEIPWWNTGTDSLEVARLPARTVRVLPAAGVAPGPATTQTMPDSETLPAELPIDAQTAAVPVATAAGTLWQWISLALGLLWLLTLAAWWWSRRPVHVDAQPAVRQPPGPAVAIAKLEKACTANDTSAAQDALLQWAKSKWPGNPARSLGELAARFDGPMQQELHRLSRARFGAATASWNGVALWQAFQSHKNQRDAKPPAAKPQLEPLYRTE